MKSVSAFLGLAVAIASSLPAAAQSFPAPGLWDPQPMDADVHPPAYVGAAIAAADAMVDARRHPQSTRNAGAGPAGNPVQETCSLQVGSVALPSGGVASNQTIVANASVTGTIIQICR